jgi:undecaprenyl-diphosphatase
LSEIIEGIFLGLIQGVTEFLPISSTAHLRVVPAVLGWPDPGAAFTAVTQLGTLLAVLVFFWNDLWRMGRAFFTGLTSAQVRASADYRLAWYLVAGTIPIAVAGVLFEKEIESSLRSLWVICAALAGLAVLLLLAEILGKRRRDLNEISLRDAIFIGLAQAVALVPGSSRSGVTITAGMAAGLKREAAARFSFLLSVPAVAASGIFEGVKLLRMEHLDEGWLKLLLATSVAAVSGYLAIAWLINLLKHHSTWVFIVYRILLAAVISALLLSASLSP